MTSKRTLTRRASKIFVIARILEGNKPQLEIHSKADKAQRPVRTKCPTLAVARISLSTLRVRI